MSRILPMLGSWKKARTLSGIVPNSYLSARGETPPSSVRAGGPDSMDARDLKKWRKRLSYNQFEAAKQLGVRRASIQNWEQELWPIPRVVELATHQIMRRWKQRREFGPVLLIYTEEPIWQQSQRPIKSAFCTLRFVRITKLPCSMLSG